METVTCSECARDYTRLVGSAQVRPLCRACVRLEMIAARQHLEATGCYEWPLCTHEA
jgi:hypothetical protein